MRTAWVFPGQGSQSVDMHKPWLLNAEDQLLLEEASDLLGTDMHAIISGESADLNHTANTQPAILLTSYMALRHLRGSGVAEPKLMAGHSLGEYTALLAAGCFDFATALRLVAARGNAMAEAGERQPGLMAAVIGLSLDTINEICDSISQASAVVSAANINAKGQIVVAGHAKAVQQAMEACKQAGAKIVKLLPVSVASHTPLMAEARQVLADTLTSIEMSAPSVPVLRNIDGEVHDQVSDIKKALCQQIVMPVQWVATLQTMKNTGIDCHVELAPGKVLTGLCKRTQPSMTLLTLDTPNAITSMQVTT